MLIPEATHGKTGGFIVVVPAYITGIVAKVAEPNKFIRVLRRTPPDTILGNRAESLSVVMGTARKP
jgi:hypothetical protein